MFTFWGNAVLKIVCNYFQELLVFLLLGIVVMETPKGLWPEELSYQWLWFSRLGFLFSIYIFLNGILTMGRKQNDCLEVYANVVWSLIIYGGIEAVWGLCQLYGLISSNHSLYKLTGSFFNPGPYSGYLAMIFPLCLNEWLSLKGKRKRKHMESVGYYLSGSVMLLILCILPAGMSRSAWMAIFVSGIWVCGWHYSWRAKLNVAWRKHRQKTIGIVTLVFIGLIISGTALFYFKKDSANGRIFMWKISCLAIERQPMGYGVGKFAYAYGNVQEEYFKKGNYSQQEELVAGSPEYAFNEYLQIGVEWGIIVLFCVLMCISFCLWLGIKKNRISTCGGVISLLVFAFSSYPMQIPAFVVSFIFLLAACVVGHSPLRLLILALCIGGMGYYIRQNNAYEAGKEWASVKMLYKVGAYEAAKENYGKLYAELKNCGSFLFEYGHTLHKLEEYDLSTGILEEAEQFSCDPMILNIIGKNYQGKKEYEKAEEYLIRATHRLPGRIYPYYLLAKLYNEWGKEEKMQEMADIVLTKEPKIQSTAIREMKSEIKKMTKNICGEE